MRLLGIERKLEQGSDEWLAWRTKGIGGSEASVLTGNNPFTTVEELWKEKMGLFKREFSEEAQIRMKKGQDMEPVARAKYIKHTGIYVEPAVFEHAHYPFLRASLDGITRDRRILQEIKVPTNSKVHDTTLAGEVTTYYKDQLQWGMLVSGAEEAHFFTYFPDYEPERQTALVIVQRDEQQIQNLMRLGQDFQRHVDAGIPPGEELAPLVLPASLGLVQIGGYAQVGKDTVGEIITSTFGATRYAYADKLKWLAKEIGIYSGDDKKKAKERMKLIALGDGGRVVYPDYWVKGVFNDFTGIFQNMKGAGAVITDMRKVNELVNGRREAASDGVPHRAIWVDRPGVGPVHPSERDETRLLRNVSDRIIVNDVEIKKKDNSALTQAVMLALSNAGPRVVKASSFVKTKEKKAA